MSAAAEGASAGPQSAAGVLTSQEKRKVIFDKWKRRFSENPLTFVCACAWRRGG
jgi:hypothetical protein